MEQLQLPVYASCVSKEEPRMETILEIYNRIVGEELRKNMIWGGDKDLDTASN